MMESHKEIEQAAAAWLARRDRKEWGDADEAALRDWMSASVAHRVAFIRLEAAWAQAGRLKDLTAPGFDAPQPVALDEPRRMARMAIAAVILVGCTAAALWAMTAHTGASYRTAVGSIKAVPMRDGSTVTLNTDSGIRVALSDTERRVDLDKGEAFFEVAKDLTRPFVVRVG